MLSNAECSVAVSVVFAADDFPVPGIGPVDDFHTADMAVMLSGNSVPCSAGDGGLPGHFGLRCSGVLHV